MRPLTVIVGFIIFFLGVVWAFQGANLLPATFMRGPVWIGAGSVMAVVGIVIAIVGVRKKPKTYRD